MSSDELYHYGILRKSGRYPWGSGDTALSRSKTFLGMVDELRSKGMTQTEISRGLGFDTTTEFRAANSIAKNASKAADISQAERLKAKGMSNSAIGRQMGINESSVRSLLAPGAKDKNDVLVTVSNFLKEQVAEKGVIDVGSGVEGHVLNGISDDKLKVALKMLKEEGYAIHKVQVDGGKTNNKTTVRVLAPPGTTYKDIVTDKSQIKSITGYTEDGGRSMTGLLPPIQVSSSRVGVRYAEQGGDTADGVIYVRPGKDDLSLGASRYAQVRVAVDGTHYLKGMAVYRDDLPDGVDLLFNTNKSDTGNKLDALKKVKDDPDNPFGSMVRQIKTLDKNGNEKVSSAMNLVNEEGDWENWSRNLSTQFASKQSPILVKTQLAMTYERRQNQLDEIMSLTNPAVRKKLLDSFADDVDSAAVHLKAAALPRQASHVILPAPYMKPTEVYAPNYRDGERVSLVRFPHGGTFEIPELVVNNRNPKARKELGNAKDAIGIHPDVAKRLSGADFDGDTVLVIPNNSGAVKSTPALAGLKDFDPQKMYPKYEGMPKMDARTKQMQMGLVSNLITDMTIKRASTEDLARAVRHSMVVIDAEKHELNWKQSAVDNGIPQLMKKYQERPQGGAKTLISQATSTLRVPERRTPRISDGEGPKIDPLTGKKRYVETGASYVNKQGKTIQKTTRTTKLAEAEDANSLSSGTPIEKLYAEHSNSLKALANQARKEAYHTPNVQRSPAAAKAYESEVKSLDASLQLAIKNRPLERQARILASTNVQAKRRANPDMEPAEIKKLEAMSIKEARIRTGAEKTQIKISDTEWAAIQAGAVSNKKLNDIMLYADLKRVKELATPKTRLKMTATKTTRAKQLAASGYTQAEIADALGVSLTTLKTALGGEE